MNKTIINDDKAEAIQAPVSLTPEETMIINNGEHLILLSTLSPAFLSPHESHLPK